jgi:thiamine monophosphate kinase
MTGKWENGEKEFLKKLFSSMGKNDFEWRDDAIITSISHDKSLLYSIDNVTQIYAYNDSAKNMICYGRWAASVISNDIIACGKLPSGLALDIGIDNMSENDFQYFIQGVLDVCREYKINYEGGNINNSSTVSGVAWGLADSSKIIRRSGAKDNSTLITTCDIGVGWAIYLLGKSKQCMSTYQDIIGSYKENPIIDVSLFQEIWDSEIVSCGMDLTDGVIEFGYEIYDRTGLGVLFDIEPCMQGFLADAADKLKLPIEALRFEAGYDTPYAHGWCIQDNNLIKAVDVFNKHKVKYTILGKVSSDFDGVFSLHKNKLKRLPRYWDDKMRIPGNIDSWKKIILPIFQ